MTLPPLVQAGGVEQHENRLKAVSPKVLVGSDSPVRTEFPLEMFGITESIRLANGLFEARGSLNEMLAGRSQTSFTSASESKPVNSRHSRPLLIRDAVQY